MVATKEVDVTGGLNVIGLLLKFGIALNPAGSVHKYEFPPLAVSTTLFGETLKFCEHIVFVPAMETVGFVITETFATALAVQPCALVTTTT